MEEIQTIENTSPNDIQSEHVEQTTSIQEPTTDFSNYENLTIEEALDLISYPPEPQGYPTLQNIKKALYGRKIFRLEHFLHQFLQNRSQLETELRLERTQMTRLAHELSAIVLPKPIISSFELFQKRQKTGSILSTGCVKLDKLLNGGFRTNQITEISGEAGSAKTQLCLQLCVQVQLPIELGGLNGKAIYVSTEGAPPQKRLFEIVQNYVKKLNDIKKEQEEKKLFYAYTQKLPKTVIDFTDNIFITKVQQMDQFENSLEKQIPNLCKQNGDIRLLIIDSIAALYRVEYDTNDMIKRADNLFRHANMLKKLSDMYNMVVIVVNQVSDKFEKYDDGINSVRESGIHFSQDTTEAVLQDIYKTRKIKPVLGLAWSNCINTRIFLTKKMGSKYSTKEEPESKKRKISPSKKIRIQSYQLDKTEEDNQNRKMHLIFSPIAPSGSCPFTVDDSGIRGI